MKRIGMALIVALTLTLMPAALAASLISAEQTITQEIVRPPTGGGGIGGITRYLRVDLWGEDFKTRVTSAGKVRADLEAVSDDEMVTLYITKGVLAQTEDEKRLKKIPHPRPRRAT